MERATGQRQAILDELSRSDRAITAQELHARLDGVGLATVYRNLQRLADEGQADTLRRESGEQAFLLCGGGHHHHLTCRSCGRVEQVPTSSARCSTSLKPRSSATERAHSPSRQSRTSSTRPHERQVRWW